MNKWIQNLKKVLNEEPTKPSKLSSENQEDNFVGFEGNQNGHISENLVAGTQRENSFEGFEGNPNGHISENLATEHDEIIKVAESLFDGVFIQEGSDLSPNERTVAQYLLNKGFVYQAQIANGTKLKLEEVKRVVSSLSSRMCLLLEGGKVSLNIAGRQFVKNQNAPDPTTLKTNEINSPSFQAKQDFENTPTFTTDKNDKSSFVKNQNTSDPITLKTNETQQSLF
jgi:hypothetical protein